MVYHTADAITSGTNSNLPLWGPVTHCMLRSFHNIRMITVRCVGGTVSFTDSALKANSNSGLVWLAAISHVRDIVVLAHAENAISF